MNNVRIVASLALCAALLGGCGSSNQNSQVADARSGSADGMNGQSTRGGENLAAGGGCRVEAVYFDYDSSNLDQRSRDTLAQDARCLQQQSAGAQITGMADPRGTEEYNLALGEGRARTVHRYLTQLGVDEQRATFRSMGEEMATGEDEAGWARDRRADVEVR